MSRRELTPLEVGALVADRYLVEKCLGVGSCAMVYRCIDKHFKNRTVALKVFHPLSGGKTAPTPARFRKEVLYSYEINHKNVVRTFDFIETDEVTALTMELIEGGDLLDVIDSKELSLSVAVDLLTQICAGVQAIHDADIVHRDLKPENILVRHDGVIKIADFSIAWMDSATKLTQHGNILGSISFISPEYLEYGTLDSRADLYALGVIAYQMVTNETPYDGVTMHELMRAKVSETPIAPHEIREDCPPELSRIIMKAMEPDPDDRYQTAAQIFADLNTFKETHQLSSERESSLSEVMSAVLPEQTALHQSLGSKGIFSSSLRAFTMAMLVAFLGYGSWITYGSSPSSAKQSVQAIEMKSALIEPSDSSDFPKAALIPPSSAVAVRSTNSDAAELIAAKKELLAKSKALEEEIERAKKVSKANAILKEKAEKAAQLAAKNASNLKLAPKPAIVPKPIEVVKAPRKQATSVAKSPVKPVTVEDAATLEYKVKAALLYRFVDYIDWNERIADASRSVNICVVGHDPFGSYLQSITSGKRSASNKTIRIRRIPINASRSTRKSCHLAFISGWRPGNTNALVEKFHRARVLTVTEKLSSGIVHFFVLRGNVRFDINEKQSDKLGVEIDPALLKLARDSRRS